MSEKYDLIIVGGGPAGMAAGIYAARSKLKTVVLEQKRNTGGQCYITEEIENYPGFPEATGPSLSEAFHKHAEKFGVFFVNTGAEKLELQRERALVLLGVKGKRNSAERVFPTALRATELSLKNVKLPLSAAEIQLLKRRCI